VDRRRRRARGMILIVALLLQAGDFAASADKFTACLTGTVRMGMTMRMKPDDFETGFAKACLDEQAAFRAAGIATAIAAGRTPEQAATEIDGNIANGRRIYAADQRRFIETGVVPR
jgi:hypothetical protein